MPEKPYTLTQEEQETHLSMVAADRGTWEVYSDDPVMQRRLEAIGAEPFTYGNETLGGKHYRLRADQVVLRKGKKTVSDAQRERMSQLRQKQLTNRDSTLAVDQTRPS